MARILVIDDESRIRAILSVVLQERGHEVCHASTGTEGLERALTFRPDLVLLDLRLPELDGHEVLKRLLALGLRFEVVMMTAHGSIRSAVEAIRQGAYDYLTKPFDNDELVLIVDRALQLCRLSSEVEALRSKLESRNGFREILGASPEMQEVFQLMTKVAQVDATVLVTGESGTGKELVARGIHRQCRRCSESFVAVNCSSIPANLIESEFFGHEEGAFTDAKQSRRGKFEQADRGTLFLDEVGDLAPEAQAKLLRVLQDGQIHRVGASRPIPVDVRVIAATNHDLEADIESGRFREDLFWRLNVVRIRLPALCKRSGDIPLLIDHFMERFSHELGTVPRSLDPLARERLLAYPWPGNVRELENTLYRAMIVCDGGLLEIDHLPSRVRDESVAGADLAVDELGNLPLAEAVGKVTERLERKLIRSSLASNSGSRVATARDLGLSRKTLFNKMRHYGISADN